MSQIVDQEINGRKWVLEKEKHNWKPQGYKEFYVFKGHIGERHYTQDKGEVVPDDAGVVEISSECNGSH